MNKNLDSQSPISMIFFTFTKSNIHVFFSFYHDICQNWYCKKHSLQLGGGEGFRPMWTKYIEIFFKVSLINK